MLLPSPILDKTFTSTSSTADHALIFTATLKMSADRGRCYLRTLMPLLSYLAAVATAAPTTALSPLDSGLITDLPVTDSVEEYGISPHSLVKRHDYYIVCGKDPQDNNKKSGISGPEDIQLARRCIANPYYYYCDRGKPKSSLPAHINSRLVSDSAP